MYARKGRNRQYGKTAKYFHFNKHIGQKVNKSPSLEGNLCTTGFHKLPGKYKPISNTQTVDEL